MCGTQSSHKLQALALPPAQTAGATTYTVARARKQVGSAQVHAALKMAVPCMTGLSPMAKEVLPKVVNISSPKVARTPNQPAEGIPNDPLFQQFFWRAFGNRP